MNGFKKIGERIKYYREKRGLDIEVISKHIGVSKSKFEEIENGEIIYHFNTLEKIASALEVDLPELLNF